MPKFIKGSLKNSKYNKVEMIKQGGNDNDLVVFSFPAIPNTSRPMVRNISGWPPELVLGTNFETLGQTVALIVLLTWLSWRILVSSHSRATFNPYAKSIVIPYKTL